ncbi:hemolysin family protein [Crenobacter cavernae]|uniref:HlyC/CorC family transporter n=1 Tax=Crenobacter cavernae TaxID=2290923 RepID=A0A345Y4V4_9NEIS|nr:hemolysin family protein [Crenobacter cavernae]AXK38956.1 HlyC/CorC family transporter [Crenobacter cavernae]
MDVLILLFLILLNGVFAMSELAIVSARKVRLQQWAEDGHRGAETALLLSEEPTRFLSTVQIGITSIGILSGVFGQEAIASELAVWLMQFPLTAPYAEPVSLAVMVVTITYFSLIFGELVPKRLAMHNPERLASAMARPMQLLSRLTSPLVRLLSVSTDTVLRLIGARRGKEPSITEEEIQVLMEQGADEGVFERAEQELVANIFRLDTRKVGSIMTPRKDIVPLDVEDPLQDNLDKLQGNLFTRFPVVKGGLDQILGMVHAKDILNQTLSGRPVELSSLLKPALYVPATISPMQLMEQFKITRNHIALVVDEYGELEGIVTMNDVLETIVGDLPTDALTEDNEAVEREDGSWLIDGMMSLDKFRDLFDIEDRLPGEDSGNIHTLGGFVMFQLGRVPAVADRFEWEEIAFEVLDMDKTRVDKMMVKRLADGDGPDTGSSL